MSAAPLQSTSHNYRRRRLQYGLRALLILTFGVAAFLSIAKIFGYYEAGGVALVICVSALLTWKWPLLGYILGLLMIGAGSFVAYWWYYKFAPSRHTLEPAWVASHSTRELWTETQTAIRRGMWWHDDAWPVGYYGDKAWAEWIMAHVKPGTSMGCLNGSPMHSALSMHYITNQYVSEDADPWLAWWEKNKTKSQLEWIADGFAQRGFKVSVPPTAVQAPILLAILDRSKPNSSPGQEPLRYNAFRCLRDSGFDPIKYALSQQSMNDDVKNGLSEYWMWWPGLSRPRITFS
jgi:hypothetical protein